VSFIAKSLLLPQSFQSKSPRNPHGGMFMREFLIVTIYAAFLLFVMAAVVVFIGLTSPINACESHTDANGNIVRCP
jgi:hypothetical protein